jgi:outer membrane assembly lipoprotein YfiO
VSGLSQRIFARPGRLVLAAAVLAALLAGCGGSTLPQVKNDNDRISIARQLLGVREYGTVVEMLSTYVTTGTGHADIDQAVYLLGLAYLGEKEFVNAQAQFERLARDYPESDSANAAAYRLGESFWGQSRGPDFDQENALKGVTQWENLVQAAPDDPWAALAKTRIAEARSRLAHKIWRNGDVYLKLKLYEPAKVYFQSIMRDYSDTPEYGDALIGNAVADARLGRRDTALVVLQGLSKEFHGQALGVRASETLAKVRKWPPEGDVKHRRHRSVEQQQVAPQAPSPTTSPYGS